MISVLLEAWRDQIEALKSSNDFNDGSLYFHCFFQLYPRDGGITLNSIITLSCFTVRNSIRCDQCWSPPPPLPPHHPHHHLPPPMSPQNCLDLIIAKAVSDADDQPLQNSPIIISQPPPLITWVERSKDLPIWKRVNNASLFSLLGGTRVTR